MTTLAWYWLPPLVWMAVIWTFSTDVGSPAHTAGVLAWLASRLFPGATPEQLALVHGAVRKLGHLTEYAILAALWFRALYGERRLASAPSAWTALALSVAWAIVDELHQAFVPSRVASAFDVLIDAAGAALSALTARRLTSAPGPPPRNVQKSRPDPGVRL